jgi:hypothetical protein
MAGNFGGVLMDYYRKNPAELAAADRRVGRVRMARRALYDEFGRPKPIPMTANPQQAVLDLSAARTTNAAERQAGLDLVATQGQLDLNLAKADRLATEEGIAGRDVAAAADRAQFDLALRYGTRDPSAVRAAQQRERSALEGPAAGGARGQSNILADAASHNQMRTEPELPGPGIAFQPETAETIINRSHREDAAADLERRADEQFAQGNTTEANKLRYTASRLRTQGGGIGGEAAEAMVGRPTAYRTASGGMYGGATGRGIDLATQARRQEGIERRVAEGRSMILGTEAEGRMATSEADLAEAEANEAGHRADIAGRIVREGPISMILSGAEPGKPNLEAAEKVQKMANDVRDRDPELAKYYDDRAIELSGGQVVQEQVPGHTWRGLPTTRPVRRVVPRPAPAPYTAGGGLYTSSGRMGLHTSAARAPQARSVLLPPTLPAQHGAGTLTLGGEPATGRGPLPSATGLRAMSDQQFLAVLRQHPRDPYVVQEAARRGRR